MDCEHHHFHVPIYSRVLIRNVQTLEPVPNGTPGLVNLITPLVTGTPLLSVMTDDLGVLHDGCDCSCGIHYVMKDLFLWIFPLEQVYVKRSGVCGSGGIERFWR